MGWVGVPGILLIYVELQGGRLLWYYSFVLLYTCLVSSAAVHV